MQYLEQMLQSFAQEDIAERHQDRIKNCGKFYHHVDHLTGDRKTQPRFCGCFRECPACRARRIADEQARIVKGMWDANELTFFIADDTRAISNKLNYREIEYRRFPLQDGTAAFFAESHPDLEGESLTSIDSVINQDWELLAETPEQKRLSGNLGKPDEDDEEIVARFDAPAFTIEGEMSRENIAWAWLETLAETPLQPSLQDLQQAITTRIEAFATKICEQGHGVVWTKKQYAIRISEVKRIEWKATIRTISEGDEQIIAGPSPVKVILNNPLLQNFWLAG